MSLRLTRIVGCLLTALVGAWASLAESSDYSAAVISKTGPVLYWELNETAGPAKDAAAEPPGGSHDGAYENATLGGPGARPSDGLSKLDPGNAAPSVNRTGAVRYTRLKTAAAVPTDKYSIQCWFLSAAPFSANAVHTVFGRGNSHGEARDTVGVRGASNVAQPARLYSYEPLSGQIISGRRGLQPDTWYHVVFVRSGENVRVYLNGQEEIAAACAWGGGDADQLTIGNRADYVAKGYSDSDLALVHYGKELTERLKRRYPQAKLGLALLNRCHLFGTLDKLVPKDVALESMESGACWHQGVPVPMERFGGLAPRETFLVPRLDDDEHELAMQFNVALYEFDGVLTGSVQYNVAGIAPQAGKLRGLEQNARYVADGAWNPRLTSDQFYDGYLRRTFGADALDEMLKAYQTLQENDRAMGWRGLGNFRNYAGPFEDPRCGDAKIKVW